MDAMEEFNAVRARCNMRKRSARLRTVADPIFASVASDTKGGEVPEALALQPLHLAKATDHPADLDQSKARWPS